MNDYLFSLIFHSSFLFFLEKKGGVGSKVMGKLTWQGHTDQETRTKHFHGASPRSFELFSMGCGGVKADTKFAINPNQVNMIFFVLSRTI